MTMKKYLTICAVIASVFATQAALAEGSIEAGKQKSQTCAACHGANGISTSSQFPILAGQYQDYIIQALHEYQSGQRKNPIMAGMAKPLSQQDIEDLAAYFSSLPGPLHMLPRGR
ncbi:MAG TPA: cytochrome c [Gammaproteobacteria bacterium]|nr:cytochrome c [Gammaproteobacteria bacterium]